MKRRDFIRTIAISSGLFLLPGSLSSFGKKQNPHLVIIGDSELQYIEQFCMQNSITSCTAIGWRNERRDNFGITINKNIEFDFSSVTINHEDHHKNKVILPKNINDIFKPNNQYLILCSLYKRNAILSKEIINWLGNNAIDFWFFGTIPLLNPWLSSSLKPIFYKYDNNPRVTIYDINVFGNKLRYENGEMLFTEAVDKCDDRLVGELGGFYGKMAG